MEFSRQEYWSGLPFSTPRDIPDPGIKPISLASPALPGRFFTTGPPEKSPFLMGFLKVLKVWQLAFLRANGQENGKAREGYPGGKPQPFCNLISDMTAHHLKWVSRSAHEHSEGITQDHEYQEAQASLRVILGCLPRSLISPTNIYQTPTVG